MQTNSFCFLLLLNKEGEFKKNNEIKKICIEKVNILQIESPVVQLSAVKCAAHLHHPSVCRHESLLQFVEHFLEQFVPKYPSIQALR